MRLNEIKKFSIEDSFVLSMLKRLLDKGVRVNIDIEDPYRSRSPFKGRIFDVQYWSTENIVNIAFQHLPERQLSSSMGDYRVRPLSVANFDENHTIKKIDGVLTFVKREKVEEELTESEMGMPLIVSILRNLGKKLDQAPLFISPGYTDTTCQVTAIDVEKSLADDPAVEVRYLVGSTPLSIVVTWDSLNDDWTIKKHPGGNLLVRRSAANK